MNFLPTIKNGESVYAGFWKRFCAAFVDAFIILPLALLFNWLEGFDRGFAIIITIASSTLFAIYNPYFNVRFGGTPGKLVAGIRITKPDGSKIGWSQAWKRSSVELVIASINLIVGVCVLTQLDSASFVSLGWIERGEKVKAHAPSWYTSINIFEQVWIWSEIVVVLFNNRKRAIHDFIAGTVVIHKQFAEQQVCHAQAS